MELILELYLALLSRISEDVVKIPFDEKTEKPV